MKKVLFLSFFCILGIASGRIASVDKIVSLSVLGTTSGRIGAAKEMVSEVKQVTVYQQGARITRVGKPQLTQGDNQLIIKGISADMDPRTLQVVVPEGLTLDRLTPRSNLLDPNEVSPGVQELIDQKKETELQRKTTAAEMAALESGLLIMQENKALENPSVKSLSEWIAFNQKKILEIKKQLIKKENQLEELDEEIEKLNKQIRAEKQNPKAPTIDVIVNIKASRAGTFPIAVMYMVRKAGWTPVYDLRVADIDAPVEFTLKGSIYQQTGLSWDNVQVELSTYQPQYDNNRPILYPSYAYLANLALRGEMKKFANVYQQSYKNKDMDAEIVSELSVGGYETNKPSYKKEQGLSVSYALQGLKTIPPNGEPVSFSIEKQQAAASFIYHAVPKLQEKVILLANIKNWEKLGLLSGEAHIFFKNNYVGKTYIDPSQVKEKLPVSLGVDERVLIQRLRKKDYNQTYKLKSNREDLYAYEIKVKNNTNKMIKIEVLDQIPLSSDSKITVKPLEYGDGIYKKDNGSIIWTRELPVHQEERIKLEYKVIYPKKENVQFRNG